MLIHGPAGVGKTLLLKSLLPNLQDAVYCETTPSIQVLFRGLAIQLLRSGDPRIKRFCGAAGANALKSVSAVNVKGIVTDALRGGRYSVIMDHVSRPSSAFAVGVRTILGWCETPIVTLARSAHMEDIGALHPLFPDRIDRFELKNFESAIAQQFIGELLERKGLNAENLPEFRDKVLSYSQGNPGAIISMIEMAKLPKYSSNGRIKISPLYIDFRLKWTPAK
jgi:hypothetical protein